MIHKLNPLGLLKRKCLRGISISEADTTMVNHFCSGNQSMDAFLQREALLASIQRKASTTIVVDGDECIAYFTVKKDSVEIEVDNGTVQSFPCLELARKDKIAALARKVYFALHLLANTLKVTRTKNLRRLP